MDDTLSMTHNGITFKVGDTVDWQDSPGQWHSGFVIQDFEELTKTALGRNVRALLSTPSGKSLGTWPLGRIRHPEPITTDKQVKELAVRAACCEAWKARCDQLKLKGVTRERQLEAFLQCYVAMGVATGLLEHGEHIQFLVAVGRGEEFLNGQISKGKS